MRKNKNKVSLDRDMILYFGLDELEVYGTFNYEDSFIGVDFDNSNYIEFYGFIVTKHEVPKYEYKLVFVKDNFSVFAYYKGKITGAVKTNDYICIYSTGFSLLGTQEIHKFLLDNFSLRKLRRFDICFDVRYDVNSILNTFKEPKLKTTIFRGEKGEIETYYIGEVKNSKNKRQLIRIYDKIKDSKSKNKHKLYSHYFIEKAVTRVEIEIRSGLAKNVDIFDDIFNNTYQLGLFKNYLTKHTDIFNNISDEQITLYRPIPKFDSEKVHYGTKKAERKVLIFQGHARNLLKIGYCPVELLMCEGIISDRTMSGLGYETYSKFKERIKFNQEWFGEILPKLDN